MPILSSHPTSEVSMPEAMTELGLDAWFLARAAETCDPGCTLARVAVVDRDRYLVRNEQGEIHAELTGKIQYTAATAQDMPCVGDWVCVEYHDDKTFASIQAVLPRKSFLRRKTAGKDIAFQMLAANVDTVFVVQSCHYDFNVRRLERYLVMVAEGGIDPVILLTKTDLVSEPEVEELVASIRAAGIKAPVHTLSNVNGAGVAEVRSLLQPTRTYCLVGSSGVGKTTLINELAGNLDLPTGDVSETGEGRHTTVRRQLHVLDNGALLVDMPGIRELGLVDAGESVEESFDDVQELAASCRFRDCRHEKEPGCAVQEALLAGTLDAGRYQNYCKLQKEIAHNASSKLERRKKDREFGQYVKSVVKTKKRRER